VAHTHAPTEARAAAVGPAQQAGPPQARPPQIGHKRHLRPFWPRFLQLLAAMVAGTIATGTIFASVIGFQAYGQVTVHYPTQILLAMAAGMSIPVVAWMLYRSMGRRNAYEMAAAIVLPVLPFLGLVWSGVTNSAQCWAYRATTVVAILVLMRYRRSTYSTAT
jgi:hypothetical protein